MSQTCLYHWLGKVGGNIIGRVAFGRRLVDGIDGSHISQDTICMDSATCTLPCEQKYPTKQLGLRTRLVSYFFERHGVFGLCQGLEQP